MPIQHACMLSRVWHFANPWTVARQVQPWSTRAFQARITGAGCHFPFRGFSWPRDWTCTSCVSCIAGGFPTCWAIREALALLIYVAIGIYLRYLQTVAQILWLFESKIWIPVKLIHHDIACLVGWLGMAVPFSVLVLLKCFLL